MYATINLLLLYRRQYLSSPSLYFRTGWYIALCSLLKYITEDKCSYICILYIRHYEILSIMVDIMICLFHLYKKAKKVIWNIDKGIKFTTLQIRPLSVLWRLSVLHVYLCTASLLSRQMEIPPYQFPFFESINLS